MAACTGEVTPRRVMVVVLAGWPVTPAARRRSVLYCQSSAGSI